MREDRPGQGMIVFAISLLIAISALAIGCNGQSVGPAPPGAFEYKSYDSLGTMIAQGWMVLIVDSARATGEWHFRKIGDPKNIGPQTGDGFFEGQLLQGQLDLDLNPQYRDNNVLLSGSYDGETFAGNWDYVGFPGVINQGRFSAVRRIR